MTQGYHSIVRAVYDSWIIPVSEVPSEPGTTIDNFRVLIGINDKDLAGPLIGLRDLGHVSRFPFTAIFLA
jgi:hypothetical protein